LGEPINSKESLMKLADKQLAKVKAKVTSIFATDSVANAIKAMTADPSVTTIKKTRRALLAEVHVLNKALAFYGLDLAYDEAKAIVAEAEGDAESGLKSLGRRIVVLIGSFFGTKK
jgi:hypothetical protein